MEINLKIWHAAPRLSLSPLQLQFSNFSTPFLRLNERWLIDLWHSFGLLNKEPCSHLFLPWIQVKAMSRKFKRRCAKSFGASTEDCYFLRFYNSIRNMFLIEIERNQFCILLMMFSKHVHMGWNFQETLKSSIVFSLKHTFMYCAMHNRMVGWNYLEAEFFFHGESGLVG